MTRPLRFKAITPAVGWSAVSWCVDREGTVAVYWTPVVVWAIRPGEDEDRDDDVLGLVADGDAEALLPVSSFRGLGLYPTAQQADPTLTADLLSHAKKAAEVEARGRAA